MYGIGVRRGNIDDLKGGKPNWLDEIHGKTELRGLVMARMKMLKRWETQQGDCMKYI